MPFRVLPLRLALAGAVTLCLFFGCWPWRLFLAITPEGWAPAGNRSARRCGPLTAITGNGRTGRA